MPLIRLVICVLLPNAVSFAAPWPQYAKNPFVIRVAMSSEDEGEGGIIVADVNGDDLLDYLVTKDKTLHVYGHDGKKLWQAGNVWFAGNAENRGLPGWAGPGVQAGDVDGDGRAEVLFLTRESEVRIVDGKTGKLEFSFKPPVPKGASRWEHLIVATFRGTEDADLLLQTTNAKGYRMGKFVTAYALERPPRLLWQTDRYVGCAHNGARVADIDGDGRDEVVGSTTIDNDGTLRTVFKHRGHLDSIFTYDVRPDVPGVEVVALEEGGGNHVFCFTKTKLLWTTHFKNQEPQNAAVGEFDPSLPGLEVWCRSRYNKHQKPFVFDARGRRIADYAMDDVAPSSWTDSGVEVICPIDWTGEKRQLCCAKERHESGDVGLFDGASGRFIRRFPEKADRLYVVDVAGDWREEFIVVAGSEIRVYHNPAPNPRPEHPRKWTNQAYRRSKMTWNYYSPREV